MPCAARECARFINASDDLSPKINSTSDKFPKGIPELEDRLRNRFEWGLIADILALVVGLTQSVGRLYSLA